MKGMLGKIGKFLLKGIFALFGALPLKVHYFNAGWLAFLVEKVFRYRRHIVWDNLTHAFPEKSEGEIKTVQHDFYRHFANIFVEAVWFGACKNPARLVKNRIVEIKGIDALMNGYEASPSVMVMYTHAGNWELMGGVENYTYGAPTPFNEGNTCFVYRKLSSELWDGIMRDIRLAPLKDREHFDGYLESRSLVRYILTHRSDRKLYNVNTDQKPYFSAPDYLKVNFMGRECNTMSTAAALASKFHMAVFYQRMMVKESGRGYIIEYIPVCEDASSMSVEEIMERYFKLLEEDIRRQPFNYLWTHNRWWMG